MVDRRLQSYEKIFLNCKAGKFGSRWINKFNNLLVQVYSSNKMVYKYKRKQDATYVDETLRQNVVEFKNSELKNIYAISKKYGIPRTLQYWREKEFPDVHSKGRFKTRDVK